MSIQVKVMDPFVREAHSPRDRRGGGPCPGSEDFFLRKGGEKMLRH